MLARRDLQKIASAKLEDAKLLFDNKRYSNAYYLLGYSVEIGLKARLARSFSAEVIPDRRFVEKIYQHDLNALVSLSGLKPELDNKRKSSSIFDANWSAVSDWSPEVRYDSVDVFTCTAMKNAVMDQEGVFTWLKNHW